MFRVLTCLTTEHDLRLVGLAGLVCFLASFAAISLFHRAGAAHGRGRAMWIITAGTALLTALALFFFGGEVLHGFAFTMVVGIITGTYSSIFIAAAIVSFWRGQGPTRAAAHAPAVATTAPQQPTRRSKPQRKARAS